MLWCRSDYLSSKGMDKKAESYGHAYSIVNNFNGYDHVHIFWFCSENKTNVSLSNKVIRGFGSGNVKQTENSEKYFSLLISEQNFQELRSYLTNQFNYGVEYIAETLPICFDMYSGKATVKNFIPGGASEWKLYEEKNYDLTVQVTGYYDLRYSPPVATDEDKMSLDKSSLMIDKIDLSTIKKK